MATLSKGMHVFSGAGAHKGMLHPTNYQFSPLVQLPSSLNPFEDKNVDIYMMCAPDESIKAFPAYHMLWEARNRGELGGKTTLIDSGSGNMGYCQTRIAKLCFGLQKVIIVVPIDLAPRKREMLLFAGAELVEVKSGAVAKAQSLASSLPDAWYANQYANHDNYKAYQQWVGPLLWNVSRGKISLFASSMGTTGTVIGMSKYLRKENPNIFVLGVSLINKDEVPGIRDLARIEADIKFPWQENINFREEVSAKQSYDCSLRLCQETGLPVGPSSGATYAGLIDFLHYEIISGNLDNLRNREGKVVACFICPDGPKAYLEKYFTWLSAERFTY